MLSLVTSPSMQLHLQSTLRVSHNPTSGEFYLPFIINSSQSSPRDPRSMPRPLGAWKGLFSLWPRA